MSPASRKRKHPAGPSTKPKPASNPHISGSNHWPHPHSDVDIIFGDPTHPHSERDPLSALYIQAYEADLVRGPEADAARSLEISSSSESGPLPSSKSESGVGSALIRWGHGHITAAYRDEDGDEPGQTNPVSSVWVDRYDARLLLDSLPPPSNPLPVQRQSIPQPTSPGWSDLPSDTEDTFFLSPSEIEDLHQAKRRRTLDDARDERVRAKARLEGDDEDDEEEGVIYLSRSHRHREEDDDRPPSPQTLALMHRTAAHIRASRDPAQLELRILANWGGDKRFSFLRSGGRWAAIWDKVKREEGEKSNVEEETKGEGQSKGLGGLEGYGSDDESDEANEEMKGRGNVLVIQPEVDEEEAKKEARRKRAKVWAEMRRAGAKDPG